MADGSRPGLRVLAERKGIRIGTCVSVPPLQRDPRYAEALAREFNVITPENALKFGVLSPSRGEYDFSDADALVNFAEAHGMEVRGHALIWYTQLPGWLVGGKPTRSELIEILTTHVTTVVGRYAGRIAKWDVVNEAIADDGTFRENLWYTTIGPEYIDLAFEAARSADPAARLFYNDYGIEASSRHSDAVYELLRDLLRRKISVDGVGLQMHLDLDHLSETEKLTPTLHRLANLGLGVDVTEFDVRMTVNGNSTVEQLAAQAMVYRQVMRSCAQASNCSTFILWGFSDRHSWVPHFFPNQGAALVFDEEYQQKPSYWALAEELSRD